jgi:ectoine hydroxylase-related dioxygenase (phytanoyl-CoA dioxygenase family)
MTTTSSEIHAMEDCLSALGVLEPTSAERESLDSNGFVVLHGVLNRDQARVMADRLDAIGEQEGAQSGDELGENKIPDILCNLIEKDTMFDVCLTHPRVLGAVAHVLRKDLKLFSMNARSPGRGNGHQGLHADWHESVEPGEYKICNSIWMLDDFTEANGATRIVPGTHLNGRRAQDELADAEVTHPDEIRVTGPAGTVAVFNSHVWHGGTQNQTDNPRHAITSAFAQRDQHQQYEFNLSAATLSRLSPAARFLLAADH